MVQTISVNDGATDDLVQLSSAEEIDQLLAQLQQTSHNDEPVLAVATLDDDPFGPLLEFGVHGDNGFVYHVYGEESAISCGSAGEETVVLYRFRDSRRSVPGTAEIPLRQVGTAIKRFAAGAGHRPDNIDWAQAE